MSGWDSSPETFVTDTLDRLKRVHDACVLEVRESLGTGSTITGALGQPMDKDQLRRSFQHAPIRAWVDEIATDKKYAQSIEDGIGPHGPLTKRDLHGDIGQFHNREATMQGWPKLVEHMNETVA